MRYRNRRNLKPYLLSATIALLILGALSTALYIRHTKDLAKVPQHTGTYLPNPSTTEPASQDQNTDCSDVKPIDPNNIPKFGQSQDTHTQTCQALNDISKAIGSSTSR